MTFRTRRLTFWLIVAGSVLACARSEPPPPASAAVATAAAPAEAKPEQQAPVPGSVGVVIDTLTIWLDSTTIQSAARELGPGDNVLKSVSEGAAVVACFQTTDGPPIFLTLTSHDGDAGPVVTATISRDAPRQSYLKSCASIPAPPDRIVTTTGLRLGMSRAEVERLLGAPRRIEERVTVYAVPGLEGGSRTPSDDAKDRTTYFVTKYREDTLVSASISRGNDIVSQYVRQSFPRGQ